MFQVRKPHETGSELTSSKVKQILSDKMDKIYFCSIKMPLFLESIEMSSGSWKIMDEKLYDHLYYLRSFRTWRLEIMYDTKLRPVWTVFFIGSYVNMLCCARV